VLRVSAGTLGRRTCTERTSESQDSLVNFKSTEALRSCLALPPAVRLKFSTSSLDASNRRPDS